MTARRVAAATGVIGLVAILALVLLFGGGRIATDENGNGVFGGIGPNVGVSASPELIVSPPPH